MAGRRPEARYDITARDSSERALKSATTGLQGLKTMAKSVAGPLAAVFGVGLFARAAGDALQFADKVEKLNRRLGANVEFLQGIKFAAEQSGTGFDTVARALEFMQDATQEAIKGTKAQKDAFAAMNIDAAKFAKLSVEKQVFTLAEALRQVDSQSKKINIARDIFGRAGGELIALLDEGEQGIQKLIEQFDELGVTMSEKQVKDAAAANDAMNRMKSAALGLVNLLAVKLGPTIEAVANFMVDVLKPVLDFIGRAFDGLRFVIIGFVDGVVQALQFLFEQAGKLPDIMGGAKYRAIAETLDGISESLQGTQQGFYDSVVAVESFDSALSKVNGTAADSDVSLGAVGIDRINPNASQFMTTRESAAAFDDVIFGKFDKDSPEMQSVSGGIENAILAGAQDGAKGMVDSLLQSLQQNFLSQAADMISGAFSGGGGGSGFLGKIFGFDSGGVVPGPRGAPQLALVHGGETILPTHKGGGGGEAFNINQTYNINGGGVDQAQVQRMMRANKSETIAAIQDARRRGR